MKFPVCTGDLPAGRRFTLQITCDQKNPEKDRLDTLIETASDPRGRDKAAILMRKG